MYQLNIVQSRVREDAWSQAPETGILYTRRSECTTFTCPSIRTLRQWRNELPFPLRDDKLYAVLSFY
jgi:hypothetical protein